MAKTPTKPEEIFTEITNDFKNVFEKDLISIILYGSGASGHYIPGKSDINFLVILSEGGIDSLEKAISIISRWRKQKVAIPLFMTKAEVLSSLDSYPIEFLTMKKHYVLVYGEDILGGLSFEQSHLRLQLERELRGKILHLRSGFLEAEGKVKRIRELIQISFTAFMSIFKALLYFQGIDIPQKRRDVIKSVAAAYPIDPVVFLKCADIKEGLDRIPTDEVPALFQAYMKEIEKLSAFVDHMNV
jgi:hypothetical protein